MSLAKMSLIRAITDGYFHMKGLKPDCILKLKQKITCKIACNVASGHISNTIIIIFHGSC